MTGRGGVTQRQVMLYRGVCVWLCGSVVGGHPPCGGGEGAAAPREVAWAVRRSWRACEGRGGPGGSHTVGETRLFLNSKVVPFPPTFRLHSPWAPSVRGRQKPRFPAAVSTSAVICGRVGPVGFLSGVWLQGCRRWSSSRPRASAWMVGVRVRSGACDARCARSGSCVFFAR